MNTYNLSLEFVQKINEDTYQIVINEDHIIMSKMNTWGKYDPARSITFDRLYEMIEW